jgi:hypothetical protein
MSPAEISGKVLTGPVNSAISTALSEALYIELVPAHLMIVIIPLRMCARMWFKCARSVYREVCEECHKGCVPGDAKLRI